MSLPFEFDRFNKFESYQFAYPVDLFLPPNPLTIASNMASLESGETFIIQLYSDGEFWKTVCIDECPSIKDKFEILNIAQYHGWPIKVEDMETYNESIASVVADLEEGVGKPVNAHLFIGFEGKGSFGWHDDEGHVMCYMVDGCKQMETETGIHMLEPGDWLFMPEGLKHRATNIEDSVMISFGTGSIRPRIKTQMYWADQTALIV